MQWLSLKMIVSQFRLPLNLIFVFIPIFTFSMTMYTLLHWPAFLRMFAPPRRTQAYYDREIYGDYRELEIELPDEERNTIFGFRPKSRDEIRVIGQFEEFDEGNKQTDADSFEENEQSDSPRNDIGFSSEKVLQPMVINMYDIGLMDLDDIEDGVKRSGAKFDIVLYTINYKLAPIMAIRYLLEPLGVRFYDMSFSAFCDITDTCYHEDTFIDEVTMYDLPYTMINAFYEYHRDDPEIQISDAFLCIHPSALCEIYKPFNKPIIILTEDRLEIGRTSPDRFAQWLDSFKLFSTDGRNTIVASNRYDAQYIKYFTGVSPILLPFHCGYVNIEHVYRPTRPEFILMEHFNNQLMDYILQDFQKFASDTRKDISLETPPRDTWLPSDLVQYRALVVLPQQVSLLSIIELYRMNIPLYMPSLSLSYQWHDKYNLFKDKSRSSQTGMSGNQLSIISGNPDLPDPNNNKDQSAFDFWISYSDYYQWPHIKYFDSVADLFVKLNSVTDDLLMEISKNMKAFNNEDMNRIEDIWNELLSKISKLKQKS